MGTMLDRARRRTIILLGVTVVLAAIVGIWLVQGRSSDEIEVSGPSPESLSGMSRLALVDGSVRADVTDRTYISGRGNRSTPLGKPKLVDGRQVTVAAVNKDPKAKYRSVAMVREQIRG